MRLLKKTEKYLSITSKQSFLSSHSYAPSGSKGMIPSVRLPDSPYFDKAPPE